MSWHSRVRLLSAGIEQVDEREPRAVELGVRIDGARCAERSKIKRYVVQRCGEGILIIETGQPLLSNRRLDPATDLHGIHPLAGDRDCTANDRTRADAARQPTRAAEQYG